MELRTHETPATRDVMVHAHMKLLDDYVAEMRTASSDSSYGSPESSLYTPYDEAGLKTAHEIADAHKDAKVVLLAGIGGSDLGTRALYDALMGYADTYGTERTPRLVPFGTIEPRALARVEELLEAHNQAHDVVLVVVSKSGGTTETVANANVLFSLLSKRYGDEAAARQSIVITDADTELGRHASEQGMRVVSMPHSVGGRYSVFSVVGLVPLALLGVDVDAFAAGGREGVAAAVRDDGPSSAAVVAAILFEVYINGARIHELFMWNPELETLGKWYRQLVAESLGKEHSDGTRIGYSPTVAIGSVDLHSVGQLIFGGRNDRMTTFVAVPSAWEKSPAYHTESPFSLAALEGKEVGTAMRAIYDGVQETYRTHDLPYIDITLGAVDAREIGAFMALHMASVMCLAKLMGVNAFDQPAVESYKEAARRNLSS